MTGDADGRGRAPTPPDDAARWEALMPAVLESAIEGILVFASDGRVLHANARFAQMWEIPPDVLARRDRNALLEHAQGLVVDPDSFRRLALQQQASDEEALDILDLRDGRSFERHSRSLIHEGRNVGRVLNFRDVTEHRRAEDRLREAEEKYRTLVESIPAAVYIDAADESMETHYVSPYIETLIGVTPEEYLGDPTVWERHLLPEDRAGAVRAYHAGRRSGKPFAFEYRVRHRDGRVAWIRDEVKPVLDAGGRVLFLQGVSYDLTTVKEAEQTVRQSEALLRATVEATTDGILVVGSDGQTLHANVRFARMWGIPPDMLARGDDDEMLAYVLGQLVDPEAFVARVRELYASDRESLDTIAFKDGRVFERHSLPLVQDGAIAGRVWVFRDVTERQRADEQLREAEARYRSLVEQTPAVTYVEEVSGDTSIVFVSSQIEKLVGVTPEEWGGKDWARWIHPDDLDRVIAEAARANETHQPFRVEYRLLDRHGGSVWVRDEAVFLGEKPDGTLRWQGIIVDITERKQAEEALREAEARFRTLVEQIPAVLYVDRPDDSLQTIYVSPQVEPMLGVSAEAWVADPHLWDRHLHPDDRERTLEEYLRFFRTGQPSASEYRWVRPDGKVLWLHDRAAFVRDERGEPLFLQGVIFDITERKEAEEELRRNMQLLAGAHAERRRLLARLVAAQEEERRRIAEDIHDDPIQKMAAVGIRLGSVGEHLAGDEEGRRLMASLEGNVQLAITRLRHLMFELRPPALDREGLAAALRQELDELARDAGVATSFRGRLAKEPSETTRNMAFRIAQEALVNARKHAGATRIDLLLEDRKEGLFVRIRDDGAGFPPDATTTTPGHLGLTTMRERASLAGGWLRLESAPGEGTTVEFCLPQTDESEDAAAGLDL